MHPPAAPAAFSAVVIGGGIVGLSTAWQLVRMGAPRVALIERFRIGHDRGSSHGPGRITRSSYFDPVYVRLVQQAHAEEWPRLERDAGCRLIHPCAGAFFGPAGTTFEAHATAVAATGADVERLEPAEARRRFPLFTFADAVGVLHDRTAGVVAAADTIRALVRRCSIDGVRLLEETTVRGLEPRGKGIAIDTDRGQLLAERIVIAAGAWSERLVPALAGRLTVKRQSVGYFRVAAPAAALAPGAFPVWIHLADGANGSCYGLPEFGREGLKAGVHEVAGAADDPDAIEAAREATLATLEAFLERQLTVRVEARVHAETCLYTCTANEDFILDAWPGEPRIVIGSACSGHGFKFGPLTGRILAGLALHGRSDVPAFEADRARFAL